MTPTLDGIGENAAEDERIREQKYIDFLQKQIERKDEEIREQHEIILQLLKKLK